MQIGSFLALLATVSSTSLRSDKLIVLEPDNYFSNKTIAHRAQLVEDVTDILGESSVLEVYWNLGIILVRANHSESTVLSSDFRVKDIAENSIGIGSTTQPTPFELWSLDRIGQRAFPLDLLFNYSANGQGVSAYFLDSGASVQHPEVSGRMRLGFNAINSNLPADDDVVYSDGSWSHGMRTASVLAGTVCGVAKKANLVSVKILNSSNQGTAAQFIAGVNWIVGDHNFTTPAVANMSVAYVANSAVDSAVQSLINDNITPVCSAGNIGADVALGSGAFSPARVPGAITVGASDRLDSRANFPGFFVSNFGSAVDVFAPGFEVWSAWVEPPRTDRQRRETGYSYYYGTSASAPVISGIVAQYLQLNPSATPAMCHSFIVNQATQNTLSNVPAGTANRLAYTAQ